MFHSFFLTTLFKYLTIRSVVRHGEAQQCKWFAAELAMFLWFAFTSKDLKRVLFFSQIDRDFSSRWPAETDNFIGNWGKIAQKVLNKLQQDVKDGQIKEMITKVQNATNSSTGRNWTTSKNMYNYWRMIMKQKKLWNFYDITYLFTNKQK